MTWWCKITKNKSFEIQIDKFSFDQWFRFEIKWDRKGDHCGFSIFFEPGPFLFSINLYDNRHWNWQKDRFYIDGEEHFGASDGEEIIL